MRAWFYVDLKRSGADPLDGTPGVRPTEFIDLKENVDRTAR
jgi:hypothetical protein